MNESFLDVYLAYREKTEPPYNYHRWCALSAVAAVLCRNLYIQFGSDQIYPNIYTMLVGESGSRKSTAIRHIRKILTPAGYTAYAPDKTTKEKFLLDLQGDTEDLPTSGVPARSYDRTTAENLFGSEGSNDGEPRCVLIAADELIDFLGQSNIDFCTMLGQLWDFEGVYKSRIKNGRSVAVPDPTITALFGTTPQNIVLMFPVELIGHGWFSRLIIIHGEKSERKYTIPPTPPPEDTTKVVAFLKKIQQEMRGCTEIAPKAHEMLHSIYHGWENIPDVRFRDYSTRRFTQLLKLSLICSACRLSKVVEETDIIRANTYLSAAEHSMPRALGEFGKGKHSAVADKIIRILAGSTKALGIRDFWKEVHKDLDKPQDLAVIIQSLEQAERIFAARDPITNKVLGWLAKGQAVRKEKYVDWNLLTAEERKLL